ncbi:unnamed protein product [Linum tenue]|uniref:Polygalacturonase n=1 Tax=Linum tenue TaxID=586396 RepID=A0AAV0H9S4_9ROSI|nr:unnamed protein product [Linum tenue]
MAFPLLAFASTFFFFSTFQGTTQFSTSQPNDSQLVSHISLPPEILPNNPLSPTSSPSEPATVFSVLSYGAVGDGEADDTPAFKMAWDIACSQTQPALLVAPAGYRFVVQPTVLAGPCQTSLLFQIDGTIMAPDGPRSWPNYSNKRQWLVFYNVTGMTVQGDGVVDGRGHKWWDLPCKPHKVKSSNLWKLIDQRNVQAIRFFMSSNLTVQGLKVQNSPQFHFRLDHCQNVVVRMLNIHSPSLSPNTDGIHIENSNNIIVHSSLISNGDDCISIGAGSYNVHIRNITCSPSHGISIGSLGFRNSGACVSNITVSDCFIHHSQNGVRIKTWQGGYGSVSQVKFHNIWMEGVRNPVIIDQYYCLSKNCSNQTSGVYIHDVSYSNIRGTYDVRSPPMHLACSDSVPCTDLELSDIVLFPGADHGGVAEKNPFCWNAYGGNQTLIVPPVSCLIGGSPDLIMDLKEDLC